MENGFVCTAISVAQGFQPLSLYTSLLELDK